MSDDTPTQRFEQPGSEPTPQPAARGEKRGPLVLILIIVGAVLLVGVIVLLVILFTQAPSTTSSIGTPTPVATTSTTPAPVPTVTVTVAPPVSPAHPIQPVQPNGNNVLITGYTISPAQVDCSTGAPAGSANLSIAWKSVNGNAAFFGVNTTDAQTGGMGWTLPPSGTQHDFPSGNDPYSYQCGDAQEQFTITVVGNGSKQSETITVKRE